MIMEWEIHDVCILDTSEYSLEFIHAQHKG